MLRCDSCGAETQVLFSFAGQLVCPQCLAELFAARKLAYASEVSAHMHRLVAELEHCHIEEWFVRVREIDEYKKI